MSVKALSRLAPIVLALLPWAAPGVTVVQCREADGSVSFADRCPAGSVKTAEREIRTGDDGRLSLAEIARANPVVLYRTPACDACDVARQLLTKRGVPFTEKNVATDQAAQAELQGRVGSLTVPTVAVGDEALTGYSSAAIELALDEAGYPPTNPAVATTAAPPPAR